MNLKPIRNYRSRLSRTSGLLKNNPVIALGLTLPFVIVPTINLKSGLLISLFIAAATIPAAVFSSLVGKKLPAGMLLPSCSIVAMGSVMLVRMAFVGQPVLLEDLGIYTSLAAVNSIMFELAVFHPRKRVSVALNDSIMMCLGFLLVACFMAALREMTGSATLWGVPVPALLRLRGMALPFAGFITIGFLSALFRRLDHLIIGRLLAAGSAKPVEQVEELQS